MHLGVVVVLVRRKWDQHHHMKWVRVNVNKLTDYRALKSPQSIIKLKIPFVGATLDLVIKLQSNYFYGFLF